MLNPRGKWEDGLPVPRGGLKEPGWKKKGEWEKVARRVRKTRITMKTTKQANPPHLKNPRWKNRLCHLPSPKPRLDQAKRISMKGKRG